MYVHVSRSREGKFTPTKRKHFSFHHLHLTVRLSLSHCTVEPAYAIDPSRAYTQGPFPSWKPTVLRRPWVDGTTWRVHRWLTCSVKRHRSGGFQAIKNRRVIRRLGHSDHPSIDVKTTAHWSVYTHNCRYFQLFSNTPVVSRRSRYNIFAP